MSEYRYQTLGARFVASFIDAVVILPFLAVIFFVDMPEIASWLVGLAMIVVNTGYFIVLHGRDGQTIGKRVMRVRVVRASDEARISYAQSIWRESPLIAINVIFFIVEAMLIWPGSEGPSAEIVAIYGAIQRIPNSWVIADAMTTLFNYRRRSIHDVIGGTVVVNERAANQALQTTPMTRSVYEKTTEFGHPQRGV